ncbi:floral homeotic protein GLOBOSA [Brachypodium distachyon]|uniref:MADS-box domain-containing protein n=1 Tax=Brachypodium distachyon TaxID=15368 RepID=I1H3V6_BRADI|nr:floral homeotic protein GLOBOSA [Brachypodium distachyon]PNT77107.1 hypothetical protein BRADI_1g57870v3 [Brachypodium distachyon]|eukprot:XP_010230083.1 floral homeotic protein GLOBOSA [Brachypodium distachyon]
MLRGRVPRRERRLGVQYIGDNRARDITFYKRRSGLFKSATDLHSLTNARVAVILETDNGRMHSFGTPFADPIVDAFLSRDPPIEPLTDQATTDRITLLQSEVARLDMENTMEVSKAKLTTKRVKEIQDENPGMGVNLLLARKEDLNLEDLTKLFNELSCVEQNIARRVPPLHRVHEQNGPSMSTYHPQVPSWGLMATLPSSLHSSSSDLLMDHVLAPNFPVQVPETLQPVPPAMSPPILNQVQELPSPLQSHLQIQASPDNVVEPPQNNINPDSTFEPIEEASPLLDYTGGDNFGIDDPFGYEHWSYALSDLPYYTSFLETFGTDVGQAEMGNGGWVNAPPESSSDRGDASNSSDRKTS